VCSIFKDICVDYMRRFRRPPICSCLTWSHGFKNPDTYTTAYENGNTIHMPQEIPDINDGLNVWTSGIYSTYWALTLYRDQIKVGWSRSKRCFSPPHRPDRLVAHPASYPTGTGGSFPGGKAAGAWSSPLTSISRRGSEWRRCTSHSPIAFME
jgi:hypothetical protein